MDCTPHKFETFVQNFELFNSSHKLYNTKIIFGGVDYIYLLSLLTNMSLTGQQDTSHPNAMKEKEDMLFQNLSLQNLDYGNNVRNKCSVNSSCNLYNIDTYINCSLNSSCRPTYQRAQTFQKSTVNKVILLLFIGIISLVGNIATISFILRTDRYSTSTLDLLQFYLALADLLVSLFCILTDAIWTLLGEWYGGNLLCKSVKFMELFSIEASTNIQVLIGLDCLSAIRYPMSRDIAKHRVRMGLIFVWTISALFSLPQVSS